MRVFGCSVSGTLDKERNSYPVCSLDVLYQKYCDIVYMLRFHAGRRRYVGQTCRFERTNNRFWQEGTDNATEDDLSFIYMWTVFHKTLIIGKEGGKSIF